MTIKNELKDWEIAREMFGVNTKLECSIVKKLRKSYVLMKLDDDFYIIKDPCNLNDSGYLIPVSLLTV